MAHQGAAAGVHVPRWIHLNLVPHVVLRGGGGLVRKVQVLRVEPNERDQCTHQRNPEELSSPLEEKRSGLSPRRKACIPEAGPACSGSYHSCFSLL